ncbi:g3613 [Coccomyxa elongata]
MSNEAAAVQATREAPGRPSTAWIWAALTAASVSSYVGYRVGQLGPGRHTDKSVTVLAAPAEWISPLTCDLKEVMNSESLELQAIFNSDHMFAAWVKSDLIADLRCFYDADKCCLQSIVQLGSGVCGYPRVLHGGFTAAFLDESLGLLFFALRQHNCLSFLGPAFTAHLEVDYKKKVEATPGRLLLCTAEVERIEGRKLWMKATLRDCPNGKVYATGRALFVSPSWKHLIKGGAKYVASGLAPGFFSLE